MKKIVPQGLLLVLSLSFTQNAHATWIGVFLQRNFFNDHIHVTVADDDNINKHTRLDIWQNTPTLPKTLQQELKYANNFIIFHHDKNKDEILSEWDLLYNKIVDHRNLLHKNCAYTTRHFLTDILKMKLYSGIVPARWALFVWQPYLQIGIPLPGAILKKLRKTLEKAGIQFYDKKTLPKNLLL